MNSERLAIKLTKEEAIKLLQLRGSFKATVSTEEDGEHYLIIEKKEYEHELL